MPERHETPGELTQPFSTYEVSEAMTTDAAPSANGEPVSAQPSGAPSPSPVRRSAADAPAVERPSSSSPWFTPWDAARTEVFASQPQQADSPDSPASAEPSPGNGAATNGAASDGAATDIPVSGDAATNGPVTNGAATNGAATNSSAEETTAVPEPAPPQPTPSAEEATTAIVAVQPKAGPDSAERAEALTQPKEPAELRDPRPDSSPRAAVDAAASSPTVASPTVATSAPVGLSRQPLPMAPAESVPPPPAPPVEPPLPATTPPAPSPNGAGSLASQPSDSSADWPTTVVSAVSPAASYAPTAGYAPPAESYAPAPPLDHGYPPLSPEMTMPPAVGYLGARRTPGPPVADEPPAAPKPPRRKRRLLLLAAVLGLLAVVYVVDLVLSQGTVPRGVTVAGVKVAGMNPADVEPKLRSTIEPRTTQPIQVRAGDVQATIDPRTTGLQVDWRKTLNDVTSQPLNPWTRFITLFSDREVGVATTGDANALAGAIAQLIPTVDRPPIEGNVSFDGTTPNPVEPKAGSRLDLPTAADVLRRDWVSGHPVVLPMIEDQPTTTLDAVKTAIEQVAKPAVAAPITIAGEKNKEATIAPTVIASALHFVPDGASGLRPDIETARIVAAAQPQLASTEQPGRDATLALQGGKPVVTPSVDGRGIDYDVTLKPLVDVLRKPTDRNLVATYGPQPAKLTTDDVNRLGITDVIGEFTTNGFAADSGLNIRQAAKTINGTVLKPGETFSLNGATGERDASTGYVEAGIIEDGRPARGIGGGVSQLATTTYNAAYFAGMTDVAHTEHSFYISRYPPAREATVFEGSIDLKFRNDNPTGVLIQTVWTPSSITVRIYGHKRYIVTSTPGTRTNPTDPGEVNVPAGQPCIASNGAPGFTTSDTRTLKEIDTGKTTSHTRTVTYRPVPKVICG